MRADEIIEKTYNFAREYHDAHVSPGHDFSHIQRVFVNASRILESEDKADSFIVKMATLLHDVDDKKVNPEGGNVAKWLNSLGMRPEDCARIIAVTHGIGFSHGGDKTSFDDIEMKIVSDADKLDAIGAIGIARVVAVNIHLKNPLFNPEIFPDFELDMKAYQNKHRKENTTINHFFDKLLRLKSIMQTDAGKREAEHRHEVMVGFLEEFFREQELFEWEEFLREYLKKNHL